MNIPDDLHKEYISLIKELADIDAGQKHLNSLLNASHKKRYEAHTNLQALKDRILKMLETSPKDVIMAAQEKPLINGC